MGSCVNFLKLLRIKLIKRRRVTDRVAAIDLGESDGDSASTPCKQKLKGLLTLFSGEEIQRFTVNLSIVIGYGGFSTVYLGRLPDSSPAAVKIQCSSERLDLAYKQELQILFHLHHPNIVKVIGHYKNTEESILVMEYVPNGNLQEALHGSNSTILPWKNRMLIAFQIAQAMEYLHDMCSLQIVHGDIKSSNVLLDKNLNCKLCDFGSSKMGFSSLIAPPSSMNRARAMMVGSPGYTDPHYLRTGLASKKNDVYSFGVIVLELITGMEAVDPASGAWLTERAQPMLQKAAVVEMVDPRVREEVELEEAKAMAALTAACLADSPGLRPCASEILATMTKRIPSALCFSEKKLCRS